MTQFPAAEPRLLTLFDLAASSRADGLAPSVTGDMSGVAADLIDLSPVLAADLLPPPQPSVTADIAPFGAAVAADLEPIVPGIGADFDPTIVGNIGPGVAADLITT